MLQYVIAGLVLGGIYAIAASGLVVTYLSAGILNFSFGALAYAVARFYYFLNSEHQWAIVPAGLLSILGLGPALGVFLYFALFRLLRLSSPLVKVVATLGVSVAIPPLCTLIFGSQTILKAPGLAPQPVRVFDFLNVPVTMDQIIVYICVVLIVVIGAVVLRYTDIGLRVRAMVDSPAMTSLSGTNPGAVSVGVWAASIGLAGLTGVLSAPIIGLDPGDFTLLMVAAFAAVIAAKLRNLPVAVLVGLGMGIAGALVQYWLPPSSSFTAAVLPSIPFVVTAIFLIYFMIRSGGIDESAGVGGALDRAITPQGEAKIAASTSDQPAARALSWRPAVIGFVIVCLLPLILHGFWVGLVGQGVCFGIIYLSFTLVTGEGGMIWLCQSTWAGAGGMTMAILAVDHGWPVMAAVLVGGLVAMPFGVLIGILTIRLGNLYVALVTLTFGLLVENLVFSRQIFQNSGIGINVTPPQFASGAKAFAWLALAVFAVIALLIVNLRRSTTGLALNAVRWSEPGAKTLGISVLQMKLIVSGFAAFVAGIGGAMLALSLGAALSANYATLIGVVWLATVVTLGIRSNVAALFAGLASTLLAGVALVYLPKAWGNVPPILFGLGAIAVARYPDGTLAMQARQIRTLWTKVFHRGTAPGAQPGPSETSRSEPPPKPQPSTVNAAAGLAGPDAVGMAPS
ncbi:MAG TPA: ABC transporter permease [Acidimicrobiales bacterium]|nr:ABC transporter permease [Acidimicrobiales bacterium]